MSDAGIGGGDGGTIATAHVAIRADTRPAVKAIRDDLSGAAKQAGTTAAGVLGGLLGRDAIRGAFSGLRGAIDEFGKAQEAQLRLNEAFANSPELIGANVKAFQQLNSELATKTRYDDDATASAEAQLAQFGITETQLRQLIPLVQDYAAFTGQDLVSAAGNVGRAVLGNARALKAVGIDFTATGDRAADFSTVIDLLRQHVGGFAEKEGKTVSGRLEILRNRFGELKESVGGFAIQAAPFAAIVTGSASAVGGLGALRGALRNVSTEAGGSGTALAGLGNVLITGLKFAPALVGIGLLVDKLITGRSAARNFTKDVVAGLGSQASTKEQIKALTGELERQQKIMSKGFNIPTGTSLHIFSTNEAAHAANRVSALKDEIKDLQTQLRGEDADARRAAGGTNTFAQSLNRLATAQARYQAQLDFSINNTLAAGQAQDAYGDAVDKLRGALASQAQAERDAADAARQHADNVEQARRRVEDASDAEASAIDRVAAARKKLDDLFKPPDPKTVREAREAVTDAQQRITDADAAVATADRARNRPLLNPIQRAAAESAYNQALIEQREANEALADSQDELNRLLGGPDADAVAQAQGEVAAAERDRQRAARDAHDAEQGLVDAQKPEPVREYRDAQREVNGALRDVITAAEHASTNSLPGLRDRLKELEDMFPGLRGQIQPFVDQLDHIIGDHKATLDLTLTPGAQHVIDTLTPILNPPAVPAPPVAQPGVGAVLGPIVRPQSLTTPSVVIHPGGIVVNNPAPEPGSTTVHKRLEELQWLGGK